MGPTLLALRAGGGGGRGEGGHRVCVLGGGEVDRACPVVLMQASIMLYAKKYCMYTLNQLSTSFVLTSCLVMHCIVFCPLPPANQPPPKGSKMWWLKGLCSY
jgi:hypothetical protein